MIILKLGLCSGFIMPMVRPLKNKTVNYLYYTFIIPFVVYLFFSYGGSQQGLFSSYGMLLITLVVLLWMPTIYARYQRSYWNNFPLYSLRLSLLLLFLFMVFNSHSMMMLFVFFELTLIPILAILFIGGRSIKKLEAGLYIFIFTRSTAFLFLAFLIYNSLVQHGTSHFIIISSMPYDSSLEVLTMHETSISVLIYNLATIVILVKSPLFLVHMWLPKAHVEAPVFASIILASLMLKTGGYGYFIIFISYFGAIAQFNYLVPTFLLMSIFAAIRCSSQIDVKMLIAYSSVNHIRVMLCGIILGLRSSSLGRMIVITAHGIISSALFFLARTTYAQIRTRSSIFSLLLGKSNINILAWLLMTLINAGLPPFLIFSGEVLIIQAALMHPLLIFLFFVNYILIGYYSCLILTKLVLSRFPLNVGRLINVGLTPYICNTVVLMHLSVLFNITISYPWIR